MIGNSRTSKMDDFVRLPNHSTVNWFCNHIRQPSYMPRFGYIAVYGDGTSGFGNRIRRRKQSLFLILFNTPKYEVLRIIRKNSKIGGFAQTAKTPKSEVLRSFKNIINNIQYSKIGGSVYYTQKLQNRRFCAHRKNSKIRGFA